MRPVKICISTSRGDKGTLDDIEQVVGECRLYIQGTDSRLWADFLHRADADLAVVNLNQIPGVKAGIVGDAP